jgi:hypothetical protein
MKRTMRYRSERDKLPVFWRRTGVAYRARREHDWKAPIDYRLGMEWRAAQQRQFVRVA